MKRIVILFFLCHSICSSFAQDKKLLGEYRRIQDKFQTEFDRSGLKDTNEVIMFAFKVNVSRHSSGVYKVISCAASDSIAYTYYRNFDFLHDINYKLFAQNRKQAVFIMPVAVLVHYPTKVDAGMERIHGLGKKLVNYLFLHDRNGNQVDPSQYIYLPLGIINTTTAEDHR